MRKLALLLLAPWLAASALAADVVIGQVSPLSGPLAENGNANLAGAKAYFERVNAAGGVRGNKIRLVSEDDHYKPDETVRLFKQVAEREHPVAFINMLGSNNVGLLLKEHTLDQVPVPVFGVTPGTEVVRSPGHAMLFHVQAGDRAQVEEILRLLSTVATTKIAVAYLDLPFGLAGRQAAEEMAAKWKLTIAGTVPMPPTDENLKTQAAALQKTGAQAYVLITSPGTGAALIRDIRAAGDRTPIYSLSYVPSAAVVAKAGVAGATGVGLAQTTPNPMLTSTGLTREFHETMQRYAPPGTALSPMSLSGYIAAKVVVEALKRCGPNPTPAEVAAAARTVKTDFGGYEVDLTHGNVGSHYVSIGVIDRGGVLRY